MNAEQALNYISGYMKVKNITLIKQREENKIQTREIITVLSNLLTKS